MKTVQPTDKGGEQLLDEQDKALVGLIQSGLPICSRPYQRLGEQAGMTEEEVIARLQKMQQTGCIKRMGVIVRHRELGYQANAMVVWDVPDEKVSEMGQCLSQFEFTTLCYRRPRCLPDWPYNLFCMIHGHSREEVMQNLEEMISKCNIDYKHQVLFSRRCFKQRGAVYQPEASASDGVEAESFTVAGIASGTR